MSTQLVTVTQPLARRGHARRLSVAPMMDCTDHHFRALLRTLTSETFLYTEMITTSAVLDGDVARRFFGPSEQAPLILQLGGDDPRRLARCAKLAEQFGYVELNLNVGCPSPRVQSGGFGAALMLRPQRVAACVSAMREASSLPVTVKHRLGVDERDSFDALAAFVETVAAAGCDGFIVHARKACLSGLSPRQNREVPPLRPEWVYALKSMFADERIELNGGIRSLTGACEHLQHVDGVMIGRAVRDDPMMLARADALVFGSVREPVTPREVVSRYVQQIGRALRSGVTPVILLKPLQSVYVARPGARAWRRGLDAILRTPPSTAEAWASAILETFDRVEALAAELGKPGERTELGEPVVAPEPTRPALRPRTGV